MIVNGKSNGLAYLYCRTPPYEWNVNDFFMEIRGDGSYYSYYRIVINIVTIVNRDIC